MLLQLENLVSKNYFMNMSAKEAFKSYVRAYDSHHLKNIFHVNTLDLAKVALSFGFTVPPAVDLRKNFIHFCVFNDPVLFILEVYGKKENNKPEKRKGGGGYGYFKNMNNTAAVNLRKTKIYRQPVSKRDNRQFSR